MKIEYVFHKDITDEILKEIIKIKSVAWPYSSERQLEWIQNNITEEDIHAMLFDDTGLFIAYLNLILIELEINGKKCLGYGIGNVCSIEKGKGYGRIIMELVGAYLKNTNNIGLLFCKKDLINFYKLSGWIEVIKSNVILSFNHKKIDTMIINHPGNINYLKYCGKSF